MLAEEWKLKYGGKAVTYQDYADVVTSYNSTRIAKLRAFEGHISDNFLKVTRFLPLFARIPIRCRIKFDDRMSITMFKF